MKLASGIAPVVKMLQTGIAVGLGTDGPAGSNNDFDLMEDMNLAADLQKVATMDPQYCRPSKPSRWRPSWARKVACLDREIGSLEAGKRADSSRSGSIVPRCAMYNVYHKLFTL